MSFSVESREQGSQVHNRDEHTFHTARDKNSLHGSAGDEEKNSRSSNHSASEGDPALVSTQKGVRSIAAMSRMYGKNRLFMYPLYAALGALIISTVLDFSTTYSYAVIVSSLYEEHATLLGVITTANSILGAVSQPFIAKLADVFSRQFAFAFVVSCTALGYIIIAATSTAQGYAVGSVIASIGSSGSSLMTGILVADITSLEWRVFALGLASAPYLVFTFVGANISADIIASGQWRWGYGMFVIMEPILVVPLCAILFWAQRKAQRDGQLDNVETTPANTTPARNILTTLKNLCIESDAVGLLLLALAWCLILLPFSLEAGATGGWQNPSMIAMLVCGIIILVLFALWEMFGTSMPLVNKRITKNRAFITGAAIDFLFYLTYYLRDTYYPSYVYVVTNWSLSGWTNWNQITTVALCGFSMVYGLAMRYTHRYKYIQLGGIALRALCTGLTIYATGPRATTAALVCIQIFNAIGATASAMGTQVATQGSVPHQDLAQIIAQLSLWTKLGGAVGTSVAANVWTNQMPVNMAEAGVPADLIDTLYSDITSIKTGYAFEDPIRQSAISAYDSTVRPLFIASTVFCVVMLVFAAFMPNYYLGKSHNKVEGTTVEGDRVDEQRS